MATLTSTIQITGAIGGRKVNIQHTYTMEELYDVASYLPSTFSDPSNMISKDGVGGRVAYKQDTPNYILVRNNSTNDWGGADLETASPVMGMILAPGQTCILLGTTGVGDLSNAPGSTTLRDVQNIATAGLVPPFRSPRILAFVGFNAIS